MSSMVTTGFAFLPDIFICTVSLSDSSACSGTWSQFSPHSFNLRMYLLVCSTRRRVTDTEVIS